MLGNCEKMLGVLISSPPPNEWPQNINHIDDPKQSLNNNNPNMASLAATITTPPTGSNVVERIMDQKVGTTTTNIAQQYQHQKQDQAIIRCPRCDSTNTKFCYYNNYSLSQPRYFCKACKRYWTKGGTLRNVPVGGGCRKNKRVKRPSNNSSSSSNNTTINNNNNNSASLEGSVNSATSSIVGGCGLSSLSSSPGAPIHDLLSSASNHHQSHHPLFYGFPTSNINFPFSRYDLQNPPPHNGLGLGFSSGLVHNMNTMNIHHGSDDDNNNNNDNNKVFQDLISSNPLLSNYATTTTTTTATTTTTTPRTISSLLGSSLHQMKGSNNNNNNFHTLLPSYEDNDLHMKEVKMELQGQNRSFDNHHWDTTNTIISTQNQMDHNHHRSMVSSSDPSILWGSNTGANLATWLDPTNNLGSSVPSLI